MEKINVDTLLREQIFEKINRSASHNALNLTAEQRDALYQHELKEIISKLVAQYIRVY